MKNKKYDKKNTIIQLHMIYLQAISSIVDNIDNKNFEILKYEYNSLLSNSHSKKIQKKLPKLRKKISDCFDFYIELYPIKTSLLEFCEVFIGLVNKKSAFIYGVEFGWLNKYLDLSKMNLYDDLPYHYKIGIFAHRGYGSIEEDFLLNDAFNFLIKAEENSLILSKLSQKFNKNEAAKKMTSNDYRNITYLKFEICRYSRITIISFYSFVECFVNSIGYSFIQNNKKNLEANEIEILSGMRKGRYLNLKSKMERFQKIIRNDKSVKIVLSDAKQMPCDFKDFFENYEIIRNSSVHYSPEKENIWLKPDKWLLKAKVFSKISMDVSKEIWKSCFKDTEGPNYLGLLDVALFKKKAQENYRKNSEFVSALKRSHNMRV